MIKNIMENNEKLNASDKDIAILRQYFPGCFNEDGSFDVVKLQNQINDKVDVTKEGFELNFLGKSYAKLLSARWAELTGTEDECAFDLILK